jgi:hypothetical protein
MLGAFAAAAAPGQDSPQLRAPGPGIGPGSSFAVGKDAYVYGYPMMVISETKDDTFKDSTNHFIYLPAPPTPSDRAVVRPDVDTLYTTAFLDLTSEPVVVHMPDTHGRYDVMQMMDANSNVFASLGKRTTGTGAHDVMVVGPYWNQRVQLVAGMTELHAPTNLVWVINRTQVNGSGALHAVNDIQRGFGIAPLGQWPQGLVKAASVPRGAERGQTPPEKVRVLHAPEYFNRLAILLRDNLPPPADAAVLQEFATIGLVPGQPFSPSPDLALALEKSRDRALEDMDLKADGLGRLVNGWRVLEHGIGVYGTDYLQRAAVAERFLGANLPEDAVYPSANVDENGQPLSGGKAYTLHFEKDQIPPVNAFWSITLYDKDGFFVPNALERYAVRGESLKRNSDGSVDVYVQADRPSKDHEPNWLPAPKDGPFNLLLRMYWPKQPVLDGAYEPPPVRASSPR